MQQVNVEIFSPAYVYRSSCLKKTTDFEEDYLNIVSNKVELLSIIALKGDYIRLTSDDAEYCGIITGVEVGKNSTTLTYKSCMSLINVDVHFDLTTLSSTTLESWLASILTSTFKTNSDTLQNILGLSVTTTTSTSGTTLGLTENIANLLDLATTSFKNYGVVFTFSINPQAKTMDVKIGRNVATKIIIEADLPNITKYQLTIKKSSESTNKIIIVNEDLQTEKAIYFRHSDDTVSTIDTDRITPVIFKTVFAKVSSGSTFAQVTLDKAKSTLTAEKLDNLIEINGLLNDDLINPSKLKIGQDVTIIQGDISYNTVLTGREIKGSETKLIFGAIRQEYTKIMNRRL